MNFTFYIVNLGHNHIMKKLEDYKKKRNFLITSEPSGENRESSTKTKSKDKDEKIFCVQHHLASHDHFDFRLEWGGVLISFAVPKGPSFNPKDKRLAVKVEDHPLDYADFEGVIPSGEYGAGTVMLWDFGTYKQIESFKSGLQKGSLKFFLSGERLKGGWALVQLKNDPKNWLLIKEKDFYASEEIDIQMFETSVKTGRTMSQISHQDSLKGITNKTKENSEKSLKENEKKNIEKDKTDGLREYEEHLGEKKIKKHSKKNPFQKTEIKLCKMVYTLPNDDNYIFEIKYDGYRMLAFSEQGVTKLFTRNYKDFTSKFLEIARSITILADGRPMVLDGEIIVVDQQGRSDFQALQNHLKNRDDTQPIYMVFDLLALDGIDLRNQPLIKRKNILQNLFENSNFDVNGKIEDKKDKDKAERNDKDEDKDKVEEKDKVEGKDKNDKVDNNGDKNDLLDVLQNLKFSEHIVGKGKKFLEVAQKIHLEGVVGKLKKSTYNGLRNDDWIKCKCYNRQEFIIVGYSHSSKKKLSSIMLGVYVDGELLFVGRAGTGFDERTTKHLLEEFKSVITKRTTLKNPPKVDGNTVWLKPKFVAEIQYAEITKDGVLRQASFKGLREDKSASEVELSKYDLNIINSINNQKNKNTSDNKFDKLECEVDDEDKYEDNDAIINKNENNNLKSKNKGKNIEIKDKNIKNKDIEIKDKIKDKDIKIKDRDIKIKDKNITNKNSITNKNDIKNENIKNKDKKGINRSERRTKNKKENEENICCGVVISNKNRIIFNKPKKISKMQIASYYQAVGDRMMKFLEGRLLSVVRGHSLDDCFFKKHPMINEDVERISIENDEGKTEEYFYLKNVKQLISQVQLGTIEFHAWGSCAKYVNKPDLMVFDLDPDEHLDIEKVRQGVKDLKKILDKLNLKSFLKTSGGKGYHVVVPFQPKADWSTFRSFAEQVAKLMESKWPERYTTNIRKDSRNGKIFIDFLRNTKGATSVAPYSVRAREGAKVSMPILWKELESVRPDEVDIFEAVERIKKPDPWKNIFDVKQSLK